jgi:hypothetical protein
MRKQLIVSSILGKGFSRSFQDVRGETGFIDRTADQL